MDLNNFRTCKHQFIFGENYMDRKIIIEEIENKYPVLCNISSMMGVNVDVNILSYFPNDIEEDDMRIDNFSSNFINLLIADALISKISNLEENDFNGRMNNFLLFINKIYVNNNYERINSLNELMKYIKISIQLYCNQLKCFTTSKELCNVIGSSPISIPDICSFIKIYKKLINNNHHICLMFNIREKINDYYAKPINNLVTKIINDDISVKVFTDIKNWATYNGYDNQFAVYLYDYNVIALDDSYQKNIDSSKSSFTKKLS